MQTEQIFSTPSIHGNPAYDAGPWNSGRHGRCATSSRSILPPASQIAATDLNADMLAVAREKIQSGEAVAVETANGTAPPFPDGAFTAAMTAWCTTLGQPATEGWGPRR